MIEDLAPDTPYFYPVFNLVAVFFFCSHAVSRTQPDASERLHLLVVVIALTAISLNKCPEIPHLFWKTFLAGNATTYLLRYIDLALLSRWSYDVGGPTRASTGVLNGTDTVDLKNIKRKPGSAIERYLWGLNVAFSQRASNTAYEVKNVPRFSAEDPKYVPSKAKFLRDTALKVMVCFAVIDLTGLMAEPDLNPIRFAEEKVPFFARIGEVTGEEVAIRIFTTLALAVNVVCLTTFGYGLFAMVMVGSGLSEVREWRPVFGSLKDGYSIKRFWGLVWHQMLTQTFAAPAEFLVLNVLGVPSRNFMARYIKIISTLVICGWLHLCTDTVMGIPPNESGALKFFYMQALGIVFEDELKNFYRRIFGGQKKKVVKDKDGVERVEVTATKTPAWQKVLGFVWVVAFEAWAAPAWAYPAIRRNRGLPEDQVLPFSLVKSVLGKA